MQARYAGGSSRRPNDAIVALLPMPEETAIHPCNRTVTSQNVTVRLLFVQERIFPCGLELALTWADSCEPAATS